MGDDGHATRRQYTLTVLGTVLVSGALVAVVGTIDEGALRSAFADADLRLLAAAAGVYAASWIVRGRRYRDVLAAMDWQLGTGFLTLAVFASQTANLLVPARAGDGVRAYLVNARGGVPYPSGVASLGVERVFDLVTVTGFAAIGLTGMVVLEGVDPAALVTADGAVGTSLRAAGLVGGAAVTGAAVVAVSVRYTRFRLPTVDHPWLERTLELVGQCWSDIAVVVRAPTALAAIGLSSFVIWSLDVLTAAIVLAALGPSLGPATVLVASALAVSVGNLAKVLPLTQGGIGLYEAAFTGLLVATTPVGAGVALAAAVLDHAIKNAVTIVGGIVAWIDCSILGIQAPLTGEGVPDGDEATGEFSGR